MKSTIWVSLERYSIAASNLISSILLSNYLTIGNYTFYTFIINIFTMMSVFTFVSLDSLFIREYIKNLRAKGVVFTSAFIAKVVGSCLAIIVFVTIVCSYKDYSARTIDIVVFSISIILQIFSVIDIIATAEMNLYKLSRVRFLFGILFLPIKFLGLIYFVGCIFYPLIIVSDILLFSVINFIFLNRHFVNLKINSEVVLFTRLNIKKSINLILSGLMLALNFRVAQLILKSLATEKELANFLAATRLIDGIAIISTVITTIYYPLLVKYINDVNYGDSELKGDMLIGFFRKIILSSIGISVVMYFSCGVLVEHIYPTHLQNSISLIKIYCFSIPLIFLNVAIGRVLVAKSLEKINLTKNLCCLIANFVFSLLFYYLFGVSGVVYSSFIAYFISNYILIGVFSSSNFVFNAINNVFIGGKMK